MTKNLVLLGGSLCTSDLWNHQLMALKREYTITIPDIMDFNSVESAAKHIVNNIPKKFILAGMSAGTFVSFAIVRELIATGQHERLQKLVLIAGMHRTLPPEMQQSARGLKDLVAEHGLAFYAQNMLLNNVAEHNRKNAKITDPIVHMATQFTPRQWNDHVDMLVTMPDSTETLKQITVPTLAISGQHDPICPPVLHDEMVDLIDNATHITIQDSGHYINFEQPESLTTHLQSFLNS